MDKQVYELTASDLVTWPVWFFPMDETVHDELTVRPLQSEDAFFPDYQVIVRAAFSDAAGEQSIGYIYWRGTNAINEAQPVVFLNESESISFWYGIARPDWGDTALRDRLRRRLPLTFESLAAKGLSSIKGLVHGLYYLDSSDRVCCLR